MLELMVLIPVEKGSIVGEFIICIESFGALCPVVFSIPIYLFCQTSCSLSQANSNSNSKNCPSACNSFYSGQNDTVCFHNKGNDQIGDNVSNGPIKIGGTINSDGEVVGGEVVNTTTLQSCTEGCNGNESPKESGASKLHAGVVGVLLGSIALAFMS